MSPERLWAFSRALHERGWRRAARLIKYANYLVFRCVLPPEVVVEAGRVQFLHRALGVVIDPDVRVSGDVLISHGVTIGTAGGGAAGPRVTLLDGSFIGANATVIAPRGKSITIGRQAAVGAGGHVFQDVPDHHRVGAAAAAVVRVVDEEEPG